MTGRVGRSGAPRGNHNRQVHGGAAGIKSLTSGGPLHGLALESAKNVTRRREEEGTLALLREHYDRRKGVSDLYYAAILGASSLEALTSLLKIWAWVDEGAQRCLLAIRAAERESERTPAAIVLDALKKVKDDTNE